MRFFKKHKKELTAFIYLYSLIIDLMNTGIFLIALPKLTIDLNISIALSGLMQISYLISIISVIPLSSFIFNKYGGKNSFILAICLFSFSSVLCFFSTNFFYLLFFRVLQGIGGGLLIPVGQTMTFIEYQGKDRLKISSIIQTVSSISPLIAPYFGAIIMKYLGWQYIFLFTGVLGIIIVPLIFCLPNQSKNTVTQNNPQFYEILLIVLFVISSIFIFNGLSLLNNNLSIIYFSFIFILIYSTYKIIKLVKQKSIKLINLDILESSGFKYNLFQFFIYGFYFTSFFFINTFFFQDYLHLSVTTVSLLMVSYVIPQTLSSFVCQYCKNILFFIILGQVLFLAGLVLFLIMADNHSINLKIYILAEILAGLGAGFTGPLIFIRAFSYFKDNISDVSTLWNLNRQYTYIIANSVTSCYLSFININLKYNIWYSFLIIITITGIFLAIKSYKSHSINTVNYI